MKDIWYTVVDGKATFYNAKPNVGQSSNITDDGTFQVSGDIRGLNLQSPSTSQQSRNNETTNA